MKMIKSKLKKSTVGMTGGQRKIGSYLCSNRSPPLRPKESGSHGSSGVDVKSMVISLLGDSDEEVAENVPPSPSFVPPTPESRAGPPRPAREPLREVPSPAVPRSFRSGPSRGERAAPGVVTPPPRGRTGQAWPRGWRSGSTASVSAASVSAASVSAATVSTASVSMKRPLHSPEEAPRGGADRLGAPEAKRPPGGRAPPSPRLEDLLDECLSAIGSPGGPANQEPRPEGEASDVKAGETRPACLQRQQEGNLKSRAIASEGAPALASSPASELPPDPLTTPHQVEASPPRQTFDCDGSRAFTVISEQKARADLKTTSRSAAESRGLAGEAWDSGEAGGGEHLRRLGSEGGGGVGEGGAPPDGLGGTAENGSADDFGAMEDCWFDDGMEACPSKETEKKSVIQKDIPDHAVLSTGLHNRYWVLGVQEVAGSRGYPEKHLIVTASKTGTPTELVVLKDDWESTPVAVGNVVHLEGECVSATRTIDRASGFLVLMPDLLISGTSIANSVRCMRRAVLGERFKAFDGGSRQMLNGTIVHEIFQKAAMSQDFSPGKLQYFASLALQAPQHLGEMYSLKLTEADMQEGIDEYLPSLASWANSYLTGSTPAGTKRTVNLPGERDAACGVTISGFADIEESIWSPRFGLKGKIDLTARVRVHRRDRRPPRETTVPLELKTGKESNSIEHRSQVILYTLMSLERRADAEAGLLLYLKTGTVHPVVGSRMDKRELVKLRNTLVYYLDNSVARDEGGAPRLAPMLDAANCQSCKYCPQTRNCALYNRVAEHGTLGGLPDEPPFVEEETRHLSEAHSLYFSRWVLLCTLERRTEERKGGRKNIWLLPVEERERRGGCVGNLLRTGRVEPLASGAFAHRFTRRGGEKAETCLNVGDRVVASDRELKLLAVATGYITEATATGVTCSLDRDLSKYSPDALFSLDRDEGVGGMDAHLGNLSKLMENSPISEKLRELIVDFRPPKFIESLSSVLPPEAKDAVANILKGLNKPQKQAMKKVLLSKDYTVIVGMPGTGKTTTICTLVRILHACGFSVLVTSYTHSAVDNILLKLKRFRIGFLRLGRAQKVHPDILPFTEESVRGARGVHTLGELETLYNSELVVATTCMGMKHPVFSRRRFDFCIVDEASQISQPVCLGPLFYAERFVLVGDHQQLPPIVQNQEARSLGMDESLFKRLEHHKESVVQLTVQYRMNSKIMSLSNALVYGGKLVCGSEQTARSVVRLPARTAVERGLEPHLSETAHGAWVRAVLEPENPICFLDTAQVPAPETAEKGGISNHTEAALVHGIVSLLLQAGCKAGDIGVIAPYRQQLQAISGLMGSSAFSSVEINTVDKYQGRDKSVIVVSFVRSNLEGNLGELLKDWRRLNVAITRAKHKLVMLGSAPTARRYEPLEMLLAHLERERMIYQLPPAAHEFLPRILLH